MTDEKLILRREGQRIVSPVFELVLFSDAALGDGAWLKRVYHLFVTTFGASIRLYQFNDSASMQAIAPPALKTLGEQVERVLVGKPALFGIDLHSGAAPGDAVPPALEIFYDANAGQPYAYCRVVFPDDYLQAGTAAFFDYLRQVLTDFPLSSGWAGLGFFWRTLDPDCQEAATKFIVPKLKRHPGLAHGDYQELAEVALQGVMGVNWLTLLGTSLSAALGGLPAIKQALEPRGIDCLELPQAIGLQAGERPETGDLNRQAELPVYRAVGAFLSGVMAPMDEVWLEGFDPEDMEDWLLRFSL